MADDDRDPYHVKQFKEFDEDSPAFMVRILALRVDALTREKEEIEVELRSEREDREELEKRVARMERTFQRGAGAMIVLPVIGTVVGLLFAYGKIIFAPWIGK